MAEETPKPAQAAEPKRCTPEFAYEAWKQQGKPGFRKLAKFLEGLGYKHDYSTYHAWKDKHPAWKVDYESRETTVPERLLDTLDMARAQSQKLDPDVFIGIQANLAARLYKAIESLPINTVEDWAKAWDNYQRIKAEVHDLRGQIIKGTDQAGKTAGNGAAPTLVEQFAPKPIIAPIKKPVQKGAH